MTNRPRVRVSARAAEPTGYWLLATGYFSSSRGMGRSVSILPLIIVVPPSWTKSSCVRMTPTSTVTPTLRVALTATDSPAPRLKCSTTNGLKPSELARSVYLPAGSTGTENSPSSEVFAPYSFFVDSFLRTTSANGTPAPFGSRRRPLSAAVFDSVFFLSTLTCPPPVQDRLFVFARPHASEQRERRAGTAAPAA